MNASPTSPVSWVTALILFLGPVLGPFSLLLFSAVVGALLAMSTKELEGDRWAGARYLAVSVGMAMVLSSSAMWAVTRYTNVPADVALMPVAFFLAAGREYMLGVVQRVMAALGDFLAGLFAKRG